MFPKFITLLLAATYVSSVVSTPLRVINLQEHARRANVSAPQPQATPSPQVQAKPPPPPPSSVQAKPAAQSTVQAKPAPQSTVQAKPSAQPQAQPKPQTPPPAQKQSGKKAMSFNNYKGLSSMNGFDGFHGIGNFDGSKNKEVIIEKEVKVCRKEKIEIVQQRLAVIREIAKRIVTELVCDVETQIIVLKQFHRGVGNDHNDLRRQNGKRAGYDQAVSGHFSQLFDANGELTDNDLGFQGTDVGSQTVVYGGTNWNNNTSPGSTLTALDDAENTE